MIKAGVSHTLTCIGFLMTFNIIKIKVIYHQLLSPHDDNTVSDKSSGTSGIAIGAGRIAGLIEGGKNLPVFIREDELILPEFMEKK
ncbi:hypothetical protein ADICYQ_3628 [Cyclobacterium qasimii M12-11B]|uniref:Uncharacterized protein n=1 Tax=Cyclobacterium qasimii M12-11B TaxID=641524 RepID=S7VAV5_9BACT|nr:hypothetical protein ADICYQ_3628 [Cyclobacterium qasimii M12-11B]